MNEEIVEQLQEILNNLQEIIDQLDNDNPDVSKSAQRNQTM